MVFCHHQFQKKISTHLLDIPNLLCMLPSVSKPIAVVEGLRDQRLRFDAAKLQTSVSGPTNFCLAFILFLALLPLVSSIFSS